MAKKTKRLALMIMCAFFCVQLNTKAEDDAFSPVKSINFQSIPAFSGEVTIDLSNSLEKSKAVNLNGNDVMYRMVNANERFVQGNIRASWEDFKGIIDSSSDNDFIYMSLANKMADLGLFDLANYSVSKIKDKELTNISISAMRDFYFPQNKLKFDDEMTLAEAYANIMYNNQSIESVNELLKNQSLLNVSDYANYIIALGYYKADFPKQAEKYIDLAMSKGSSNLNYQVLKAKICVDNKQNDEAVKVVQNLKKSNLYSYEYERKINSLEQFVLYKAARAQWEKDYHLGYYYYLENDSSKAIRTLQGTLSSKKRANKALVYSLMSEIYLSMNEFEKAYDLAQKSYKSSGKDIKSLLVLAELSYRKKSYKEALEYYKKAAYKDKNSSLALVGEAKSYQKLNNLKKADELYTKVLKTFSNNWEAYYNVALSDKSKEVIYLKKALSINPLFEAGWIALAKTEIAKADYDSAQKYLANAFYIDENDYQYYYYQGLINRSLGDENQAKYNFKKCLKLNSDCIDAKKALDGILYGTDALNSEGI